jgi:hypothetical protein
MIEAAKKKHWTQIVKEDILSLNKRVEFLEGRNNEIESDVRHFKEIVIALSSEREKDNDAKTRVIDYGVQDDLYGFVIKQKVVEDE